MSIVSGSSNWHTQHRQRLEFICFQFMTPFRSYRVPQNGWFQHCLLPIYWLIFVSSDYYFILILLILFIIVYYCYHHLIVYYTDIIWDLIHTQKKTHKNLIGFTLNFKLDKIDKLSKNKIRKWSFFFAGLGNLWWFPAATF